MRAGFLAGAAFVIGAIVGTFVIAPIVNRQPQTVVPQATVPPADPFENARTKGDAAMDAVSSSHRRRSSPGFTTAHAWVRALIPYIRNRGATAGTPDTWVRMVAPYLVAVEVCR